MTAAGIVGVRLADFTTNTAPDPAETSSVPNGAYYRVLHSARELPTPQNTHAWVVRTPDGEWGSVAIGTRGAVSVDHAFRTPIVPSSCSSTNGRLWTLIRGEWRDQEAGA